MTQRANPPVAWIRLSMGHRFLRLQLCYSGSPRTCAVWQYIFCVNWLKETSLCTYITGTKGRTISIFSIRQITGDWVSYRVFLRSHLLDAKNQCHSQPREGKLCPLALFSVTSKQWAPCVGSFNIFNWIYTQQTSVDSLIAVGWLGCKYHMSTKSANVYNTTGWNWMKKESINCSKHYCEPWILMVTCILPHIGPTPRRHPFHLWRSCKQLVPCCSGCSNMGHICLWNIYRHVSESMLYK